MSARVQLDGLQELMRELGELPEELQRDGMQIVREETEGAAAEISQQVERVSGTLAKRIGTVYPSSTILVGIVQSRAPHSHLYDFGSNPRRTAKGADRGRMPAKQITVPIARRRRARMARRLVELVRQKGFEVNGE